jgi:hypothetical protein
MHATKIVRPAAIAVCHKLNRSFFKTNAARSGTSFHNFAHLLPPFLADDGNTESRSGVVFNGLSWE